MYNKPICDCGEELIVYREDLAIVETPITKEGKESKKGIAKHLKKLLMIVDFIVKDAVKNMN